MFFSAIEPTQFLGLCGLWNVLSLNKKKKKKKKTQQNEMLDSDSNSKKVLSERIIPSESKMCTKYLSLKNLRWYESEYYDHSKLFAFVVK